MIVAAIQVRMNSTRLPGKALADLAGRPVLWHVVQRARAARRVDQVVIATSADPADAPIRAFAESNGIPFYAGSQTDLVDRLHQTAGRFGARALVRVTADCPLVDPLVMDQLVGDFLSHGETADYVCNTQPPTFPDGLDTEVFPTGLLAKLSREVSNPFWREWFTSYLADPLNGFRARNVRHFVDLSALRWTLDYEEDLAFLREIYGRLYRPGEPPFTMEGVLSLLRSEPALAALNASHSRNEGYAAALATHQVPPGDRPL